jgi:hypothetical protein
MKVWMRKEMWSSGVVLLLFVAPLTTAAQSAPIPVKPGLWETTVTVARVAGLPPEAEAKIAAMPPAQQAQVRAMMSGGAGGGQPAAATRKACFAPQTSLDSILNQAQQSSGMQCTFTNRAQTAHSVSFDLSCTGQMGNATGHTEYHIIDDDHMSGSSHMTVTGSSRGTTTTMKIDTTSTGNFLNADCGDVNPFAPATAAK